MNITVKETIKKWYNALSFDKKFDEDFTRALDEYDIDPEAKFEDYDLNCDDGMKNLLHFLYFSEALAEKYREAGISEDILHDTLLDIPRWTSTWSKVKGKTYLGELQWLNHHFSMKLYKLGRLQFYRGRASRDIPELGISKGEPVLDIHIPASGKLDRDECISSLRFAIDFHRRYYPDWDFKCFTCHSWLLDPKLAEFMPEESNIRKFANLFRWVHNDDDMAIVKFMFGWNATVENLKDFPATSTTAEKIKSAILEGERFHVTLGAIALDDIN